ncbi:MAG: acetolactate synthase, large subunit, biosynthetic type, partial [Enterobacter kobei]|nr:acetolactate synthase, large subunit, biosynthetic type [Enterobacter kobei]
GHKGQIKRALQTLIAAKKPVVYVGGGAVNAACETQLRTLIEKLNLPVASSLMGLGAFPATHRQALGMLGMHGTYEANMTMHHSDVIFAVGVRFDDRTTNNLMKYCPNATVLHIDIDPTSISKTVAADVPIVGDGWICWRRKRAASRWTRSATGGIRSSSGAPVSVLNMTPAAKALSRRR